MNNLFIDLVVDEKNNKNSIIDNLFLKKLGFVIKEDKLLKTKTSTTLFLKINIDKFVISRKNIYFFKKFIKSYIKNIKDINVVFSKKFNGMDYIRNEIKKILHIINGNCKYIKSDNDLKNHDSIYLKNYILNNKIDKSKFRILVVVDDIKDFEKEKLKEYLEEYKFVDILRMSNISKGDYKRLSKEVNDINNEYGSSMEIIQKRNIQNYDFYIIYSQNRKKYLISHYVLNKKAYILDITDVDDDVYSKEYKLYEKNKKYIDTLFNRLNLDVDNFCKTELGSLYN